MNIATNGQDTIPDKYYQFRQIFDSLLRRERSPSLTGKSSSCNLEPLHTEEKTNQAKPNPNHPGVEQIHPDLELFQKKVQKTPNLQGFQNPNNVANYCLTTNQQPTKVVGLVVGSDALDQNSWVGETADAPFKGRVAFSAGLRVRGGRATAGGGLHIAGARGWYSG